MDVGVVVVDKEEVKPAASPTSSTIEGGGASEVTFVTEEQFLSVFSNSLITNKILSYMNFGDMKACRQVSRTFLRMIESYSRFKDSQVLLFTKEESHPIFYDFNFALMDTNGLWRGVRIDVTKLQGQVWRIPSVILKTVQFVSLYSEELYPTTYPLVRYINYVLQSTPKISHLQLDIGLLESGLYHLFSYSAVRENLTDLKCLDISNGRCTGNGGNNGSAYGPYGLICITNDTLVELASIPQRLEILRFPKVEIMGSRTLEAALLNLLQRNCESLRELSLHFRCFWKQVDLCNVKLPRLRILSVTIHMYKTDQETLRRFLVNHDSLEEVDVAVREEFGKNLFYVIRQLYRNVRKLHLKAKKFVDIVGGSELTIIDWTFLRAMTRLKDFQLCRPFCDNANWGAYGNGSRLLECLPRNQLERLGFRGIGARPGGFWRSNDLEVEPELSFKLNLLRGFLNLRRLSLRYCTDAVDDDVMRFIVTEMTSLEELEVSHCSKLSDAGLKGTSEDGSSDSIRNLQGLKELSIRSCPSVTPEGILSILKLPFLRRFEYVAPVRVSNSFAWQILPQNPSLELLAVNLVTKADAELLKEFNNYPRRLTLIDLRRKENGWDSDNDADSAH